MSLGVVRVFFWGFFFYGEHASGLGAFFSFFFFFPLKVASQIPPAANSSITAEIQ